MTPVDRFDRIWSCKKDIPQEGRLIDTHLSSPCPIWQSELIMLPLDLVTFDTNNLLYSRDEGNSRVWHSELGEWVSLHYFPLHPDIEADITDADALKRFFWASAAQAGIGCVETWPLVELDGCRAVRRIIKRAQNPDGRGRIYVGSVTLPFRDFSYVIRVEAAEGGFTGIRESFVTHELLSNDLVKVKPDPSSGEEDVILGPADMEGWTVNVIDDSIPAHLQPNVSEDPQYDNQFPKHPLSRVRALLRKIEETLKVDESVKRAPPFVYTAPDCRSWWQRLF